MSELLQMRQRLLDRLISGEIDQIVYDRILGEIQNYYRHILEEREPSGSLPRKTSWIDLEEIIGASPRKPGCQLGKFKIENKLGRGGMGEVWKAWDTLAERHVVIKTLPASLQTSECHMAQLKASFQRVHELQHQHICPVYDFNYDEQSGYCLVMKFIPGRNLLDLRLTNPGGKCPMENVLDLLAPVAEALDYAHLQNVMHRDVKPENIMIQEDGADVQVVDFGLAAQIRTSLSQISQNHLPVSGTPPYMAPEQWTGRYQDGRTDEYALAVVGYQLLSGHLPFESEEYHAIYHCALYEPMPYLDDQAPKVNEVLAKGMAKAAGNRYPSCQHFVQALADAS